MLRTLKHIFYLVLLPLFIEGQGGFKKFYHAPNSTLNYAKDVIEAPGGNIIVSGLVLDTINGQKLSILGLDANGTELWRKNYGNDQLIYLENSFISRTPFIKDQNGFFQTHIVWDTTNTYHSVLMHFDYSGDTLWQKHYYSGVVNEYFYVQDLARTIDGGFLLSGFDEDLNLGQSKVLLIKTDANGNELWRKTLASPISTPASVWWLHRSIQDSTTKRIVSVGFRYDSNWRPTALLFIADSLGNSIYSPSLSGINGGYFRDLTQTNDGNFVAVGEDFTNVSCGNTFEARLHSVKFNINGSVIWSKKYDAPNCYNTIWTINETNSGDLILGSNLIVISPSDTVEVCRIQKTDYQGNTIWEKDYDFASSSEMPRSVHLGTNGNIYTVMEVQSSPSSPYILVKLDSMGCDSTPVYCVNPVSVDEFYEKTGFSIEMFPNPANEIVKFAISSSTNSLFQIRIIDLQGRDVESFDFNKTGIVEVDTRDFSAGLYLVRIFSEGSLIETKKLVIAK